MYSIVMACSKAFKFPVLTVLLSAMLRQR